ncbi:MAG: 50S ribosomal protein L17 [Bacilli bacterium]|nr:50S ribosomal protein L17 [Bacilli bacterium]MBQ6282574.1 50S ribosomal protein L17 [Bacilli bacterium]
MAYRKLGVDNKHRRSMLANLTKDLIMKESINTTETRAKEVRKSFDKMVTYAKEGSLVSRRKILAFLQNDNVATKKVFDLAERTKNRNGGYTTMLKLGERKGDDALMVILKLVDEAPKKEVKEEKKAKAKKEVKEEKVAKPRTRKTKKTEE